MRRFGLTPSSASLQLARTQAPQATEVTEPLPTPRGTTPYRVTPADLGLSDPTDVLSFHVIGDHGGVLDPKPQMLVAAALEGDHANRPVTACYTVGDVVYFNGDLTDYSWQFGEPYAHYGAAIIGIPGNHDGDTRDDESRQPLDGWMAHFCAASAALLPGEEEYERDTETQPNCFWTLTAKLATIIGLYSNVPSGGVIEDDQAAWLESELAAAPTDRALIVALHHPPYSCDAHHGGSQRMGTVLDSAFLAAKRWPELVITGHVHNYQRFTRDASGQPITYVVSGNGGYHNLHRMASGIPALPYQAASDVVLNAYDDQHWGFTRLDITPQAITGSYRQADGTQADTFTLTVGAAILPSH